MKSKTKHTFTLNIVRENGSSFDMNLSCYQVARQARTGLSDKHQLLCSSWENAAAALISSNILWTAIHWMYPISCIMAQCVWHVFIMFCSSAVTPPKLRLNLGAPYLWIFFQFWGKFRGMHLVVQKWQYRLYCTVQYHQPICACI